jgi:hypothetical protein
MGIYLVGRECLTAVTLNIMAKPRQRLHHLVYTSKK